MPFDLDEPEFIIAFDVKYMEEGVEKCEMVEAKTPQLAIEKLCSMKANPVEILATPKYHNHCNLAWYIWKQRVEKRKKQNEANGCLL